MLTIVFRDKSLSSTLSAPIYQFDNNADKIKCIIPTTYDGLDLKDATVTLLYKDEKGNGGLIELKLSDELFNKDHYQYVNKINSRLTQVAGRITVWLRISDYINDYSFETGETSFNILPSKEIPKDAELNQLSYFDQWLIKMNQLYNMSVKNLKESTHQNNITRKETERLNKNVRVVVDTKAKKGGGA